MAKFDLYIKGQPNLSNANMPLFKAKTEEPRKYNLQNQIIQLQDFNQASYTTHNDLLNSRRFDPTGGLALANDNESPVYSFGNNSK